MTQTDKPELPDQGIEERISKSFERIARAIGITTPLEITAAAENDDEMTHEILAGMVEKFAASSRIAVDDYEALKDACWSCLNVGDPWRHEHEPEGGHWHHYLDPGDGLPSPCENSDMLERIFNENARQDAAPPVDGLRRALELAVRALEEAEAILGGEYGDFYGPFCDQMMQLKADARQALASSGSPWRRVEDGLPELKGHYYVTTHDGQVGVSAFYLGSFDRSAVAWMPYPTPYDPTGEEADGGPKVDAPVKSELPPCVKCSHSYWLHAEMDFNGNRCCECDMYQADGGPTL